MNSQPLFLKHYSSNKEYKHKHKHIHKLSDSNIEDSFLEKSNTHRHNYKSPVNYKLGVNKHPQVQSLRPSVFQKDNGDIKQRQINNASIFHDDRKIKSPKNYFLYDSRLNSKSAFEHEPYLSVSMVQGINYSNFQSSKNHLETEMKQNKSPARELTRNHDDIIRRIKKYLSPRHQDEQSFINKNSTINSKYSSYDDRSTMQSHKVKSNQYQSSNYLTKIKTQTILTKQTGFNKKKDYLSPNNKAKVEQKGIKGSSLSKNINKFISPFSPNLSNKQQKTVTVKDFVLTKVIGYGQYATVYQAIHKSIGCIFALKKISKATIKNHSLEKQLILQIRYHMYFNHPNIVKMYGYFSDKQNIYLILEYMQQGTLFQNLQKRKQILSQSEVVIRVRQIAEALSYLHDLDVVHRDIKPQNIVMSYGIGKLCDFGWATICEDRRKTYCGSYEYAAPQILDGKSYNNSVDIWCLGVLAYQLLTGNIPFSKSSQKYKNNDTNVKTSQNNMLIFPKNISKLARNFIEITLRKDSKQRAKISQLLKHQFLIDN